MLCMQKTSQNSYVQHLKAQVKLIGNLKELQPVALLLCQLVHYWNYWTSVPSSIELIIGHADLQTLSHLHFSCYDSKCLQ